MLIDEPAVMMVDPILDMIGYLMNGTTSKPSRIQAGVYEIDHFGSTSFLRNYEHYPDLSIGPYGVCDTVEQLLAKCPELVAEGRQFVVTLSRVTKASQPRDGGWRWHKWGAYIGDQEPQYEYLYDEPEIDEVLCYHIYERV